MLRLSCLPGAFVAGWWSTSIAENQPTLGLRFAIQ